MKEGASKSSKETGCCQAPLVPGCTRIRFPNPTFIVGQEPTLSYGYTWHRQLPKSWWEVGEELIAPIIILYLSSAEVHISEVLAKRSAPRGMFGRGWKTVIN